MASLSLVTLVVMERCFSAVSGREVGVGGERERL